MERDAAVRFSGVSKRYGSLLANRDVSLSVPAGSIHAIIGENGAGKSTLMSILSGLVAADAGEIHVHGRPVVLRDASDAIGLGIGMVHQHFLQVEPMTVLENLLIGSRGSLANAATKAREAVTELGRRYGLALDPGAIVGRLSVGERQRVEIAKALVRGADILILDEPTAVLTPEEAAQLFRILRELRAEGRTVLLISHKLREVMSVADRVAVMRAGAIVADLAVAETNEAELAALMIGRVPEPAEPAETPEYGLVVLAARQLRGEGFGPVDLTIRAGEILGVAGVAGNGQTGLLDALAGLLPSSGALEMLERPIGAGERSRECAAAGIAYIPEDRERRGIVPGLAAWEAFALGQHRATAPAGFLAAGALRRATVEAFRSWGIRPADPDLAARSFSGGNQQRLVCAREMGRRPALLLAGQPTRGVDIGGTELIHARLRALRDEGAAILLVSADLDEILALSDRIVVMVAGRFIGEMARRDATELRLGRLMGGIPHDRAHALG